MNQQKLLQNICSGGYKVRYHFVGIGGIGMSSLAMHLRAEGHEVYGSNNEINERSNFLRSKGFSVYIGHSSSNWEDPDILVRTTAVKDDNPEVQKAVKTGVPVVYRMEALKRITKQNNSICITGTDGKTTTTAMLSKILIDAGCDPSVLLGGINSSLEFGNYRLGAGPLLTELDESDGFFASVKCNHAVVTNVRNDHLEHYSNKSENLRDHFWHFGNNVSGLLVYNSDDPILSSIFNGSCVSFGRDSGLYKITGRRHSAAVQEFEVLYKNRSLGNYVLRTPGEFNAYNALAAIAASVEFGIDPDSIRESLLEFSPVDRRFSFRGKNDLRNLDLIDDYAHTPDEIAYTISGAREFFPDKKIVAVFQPHRYSRLVRENGKFAASLRGADAVCVYKLYEAYENEPHEIDEREVVDGLNRYGTPVVHASNYGDILSWLEDLRDAVVIFMGAGDITEASKLSAMKFCTMT